MRKDWTIREVTYLKQNYKTHSDLKAIVQYLGRSKQATQQKISELEIAIPTKIKFTETEEKFLRDNFKKLNSYQLATALKKKRTIVRMKLYSMGLRQMDKRGKLWTAKEDAIIRKYYQTKGDTEIATMLSGRKRGHVWKRRTERLKLFRTQEQIDKLIAKGMKKFLKHSFKKGHAPTMSHEEASNKMKEAWANRKGLFDISEEEKYYSTV